MSDSDLASARKDLDKAYAHVRDLLADVEQAYQQVMRAGPEDDVEKLLGTLEDAVHKARTGGMLGSGANGHSRALEHYLKLKV